MLKKEIKEKLEDALKYLQITKEESTWKKA